MRLLLEHFPVPICSLTIVHQDVVQRPLESKAAFFAQRALAVWPVQVMCRVLNVSKSAFYV